MRVERVEPGSEADRAGVEAADRLSQIDGTQIRDAVDVAFVLGMAGSGRVPWEFARGGGHITAHLPADRPADLGITLAPDPSRTCGNRCVFCFVDQLPRGLRRSLYVKDEDYRLSFSHGNYITLTNLSDADYERISEQRLSPLYVSVHATDDAVRRGMLGSDRTPSIMRELRRLAGDRIRLHTQIVLCPGMNDGEVLEQTLGDLHSLGEAVESVAVVPVGLTAHRDGLPSVRPVAAEDAAAALDAIDEWQKRFAAERGEPVVYGSDELYLLAGRELPPYEAYGEFPQIENGVGLLRAFEADLEESAGALAAGFEAPVDVTVVTAKLAAPFLREKIAGALSNVPNLGVRVVSAENELLGPSVTVAGLLSGADMARATRTARSAGRPALVLLPGEAFNEAGLALDGMTVADVARESGAEHVVATCDLVGAIVEFAGRTGGSTEKEAA
jgi:putative radical SAM enzyme (TIGR03279 family)